MRWEYLSYTYWWVSEPSSDANGRWSYSVSARWADIYSNALERAAATQDTAQLWEQLGDDGWELVTHIDHRRDQYSELLNNRAGNSYVQVHGRLVSGCFVFKRSRDDAA